MRNRYRHARACPLKAAALTEYRALVEIKPLDEADPAAVETLLDDAVRSGRLSARGVDKVLRIAWTLADLDARDRITRAHLAAALGLRQDSWRCAA